MIEKDLKRSAKVQTQKQAKNFIGRATYNRLNSQRHDLIHKKFDDGLSHEEEVEFQVLQSEIGRLVNLAFPRFVDPRMEEILKSYEAKTSGSSSDNHNEKVE